MPLQGNFPGLRRQTLSTLRRKETASPRSHLDLDFTNDFYDFVHPSFIDRLQKPCDFVPTLQLAGCDGFRKPNSSDSGLLDKRIASVQSDATQGDRS